MNKHLTLLYEKYFIAKNTLVELRERDRDEWVKTDHTGYEIHKEKIRQCEHHIEVLEELIEHYTQHIIKNNQS